MGPRGAPRARGARARPLGRHRSRGSRRPSRRTRQVEDVDRRCSSSWRDWRRAGTGTAPPDTLARDADRHLGERRRRAGAARGRDRRGAAAWTGGGRWWTGRRISTARRTPTRAGTRTSAAGGDVRGDDAGAARRGGGGTARAARGLRVAPLLIARSERSERRSNPGASERSPLELAGDSALCTGIAAAAARPRNEQGALLDFPPRRVAPLPFPPPDRTVTTPHYLPNDSPPRTPRWPRCSAGSTCSPPSCGATTPRRSTS